jgi:hypothetical protein
VKPELHYLILTALVTGTLWVPVVIGYVRTLIFSVAWGAFLTFAVETVRHAST